MTIFAVALDYKVCWNFDKEGITLHLRRLLKSLLENYPDLVVEIYAYDNNSFRIKNFFAEIYTQYPDRVRYCLGKHKMKKEYVFKEIKYLLKYKLFRKRKHLIRYAQIHREFTNNQEKDLIYMAQNSKADAVINVHPLLTLAHNFKCKKLLQTHDLFTIPLEELWAEVEPAVKHINKLVLKNLGEYVNEGGIFVTSTEYTAQTQIREYVKGVTAEQVKVIPFPPFVKSFSNENILGEAEFRAKYGIYGKYIPYPSQNRVNKNVIVLLKALKTLRDKGTEIKFVTTGHIYGLANTASYIKENNLEDLIVKLEYLPESDLAALYKYGTVAVVPTIIEGLGMSGQCLEALSAGGIPVVHAKSMGIKESLESVHLSMETADLNWFELDDYEGLARTIEEVISNPQQHIEKQKHILSAYLKRTWQEVANDYMEIIK